MLFNSIAYCIFFPVAAAVFFLLPQRYRWTWLLGASYYFYGFTAPEYLVLLFISTIVAYFCARWIEKSERPGLRRLFLVISICTDLGMLFIFKYFDFFSHSLRLAFDRSFSPQDMVVSKLFLPAGISFYTFQNLSYVIDVYRRKYGAEKDFGIYALFVSFFPQLVAGPIERAGHLLPQFLLEHRFEYQRVSSGLKLILWGLFKKVVIADRLGSMVDQVYNFPGANRIDGLDLVLATYFFAFQIFCDFSGYSDIAIGSAQVMGFGLMDNFRNPYIADSIREFWKRWHISLVTWLRDYLYIPLGGNRVSQARWFFNILTVFVLSGLWHGANWTYIVWGAIHGGCFVISSATQKFRGAVVRLLMLDRVPWIHRGLRIFIVFHLVCFAWIFFRAQSLHDAFLVVHKIAEFSLSEVKVPVFEIRGLLITLGLMAFMGLVAWIQRAHNTRQFLEGRPIWLRWGVCYAMIFAIIFFAPRQSHAFIYFQF
jgi:D-alanyl-lipoteichoic acid acyltransferase DltB (MBOAT superfamily)